MAPKIEHKGLHFLRTKWSGVSGIRENAFAERWLKENDPPYSNILQQLMFVQDRGASKVLDRYISKPAFKISARDAKIVATVVQWLGTNIGFNFLQMALEAAGYEIVNKRTHKCPLGCNPLQQTRPLCRYCNHSGKLTAQQLEDFTLDQARCL